MPERSKVQDPEKRLKTIETNLRITKVVATRTVKLPPGDVFAGFSGGFSSVQNDAGGPGASLMEVVSEADESNQGMSLADAEIAHLMVARQAEISAWHAALCAGNVNGERYRDQVAATKRNFGKMIQALLQGEGSR